MDKERGVIKLDVSTLIYSLLIIIIALTVFNQYMISGISSPASTSSASGSAGLEDNKDVSAVNLDSIQSTAQSVAYLFDLSNVKTEQDAIKIMIPTGTPDYGAKLGVSFDDPVNSLARMRQAYVDTDLAGADLKRYVSLVTKPVGISCEHCCGLGAVGADEEGNAICGCQHNPALLGLTKWLIKNTEYSDQEIVKEALKWKTLFFPKNMVQISLAVAGTDASSVANLPGMVGGC